MKSFTTISEAIEPSSDASTHNIELRAVTMRTSAVESGHVRWCNINDIRIKHRRSRASAWRSGPPHTGDTAFALDPATKAVSQHSWYTFYEYKVVQRTVEVGPNKTGM